MEEHTHREYLAWLAYLEDQWNEPTLTDFYLMEIAAEVRRVLSKKPNDIRIGQFLLKFGKGSQAQQQPESVEAVKARWKGFVNPRGKYKL